MSKSIIGLTLLLMYRGKPRATRWPPAFRPKTRSRSWSYIWRALGSGQRGAGHGLHEVQKFDGLPPKFVDRRRASGEVLTDVVSDLRSMAAEGRSRHHERAERAKSDGAPGCATESHAEPALKRHGNPSHLRPGVGRDQRSQRR